MPFYCLQVSYTSEAWDQLLHSAQDRFEPIRTPIEKLGGQLRCSYFALAAFDALALAEFPEPVSTAEIAVAFSSGGAIAEVRAIPLLDDSGVTEAAHHSGHHHYRRSSHFAATAFAGR